MAYHFLFNWKPFVNQIVNYHEDDKCHSKVAQAALELNQDAD